MAYFTDPENCPFKGLSRRQSQSVKKNTSLDFKIAELILLNKSNQQYEFNYQGLRIGVIRPDDKNWIATAEFQYGGVEKKLNTHQLAIDWLLDNYFVVKKAQIKFSVSGNFCHYTIARDYWLIKIDVREEDCIATIQDGNNLLFEYFPTLNDAIAFSFDLILNSDRSTDCSCDEEEF
ncbi:MAG: hypothetical protein ACFBSE_22055 [Prochloraceae cyanobacterium]